MNKSDKVRFYYGIFLSALTAIVGIVMIVQVAILYYSNGAKQGVYSYEIIRNYIALPVVFLCIWIVAIICGYVLSVVYPTKAKRSPYVDNKKILGMLKKRLPTVGTEGFDEARKQIKKQETLRICVWGFTCAVMIAGAIAILIYAFNPANFTATWRPAVLALVRNTIIWIGAGLVCCIGATIFEAISIKREVEYVKTAIKTGDKTSVPASAEPKKKLVILATIVAAIITLGAVVMFVIAPPILTALIAPTVNPAEGADPAPAPVTTMIIVAALFLALVVGGIFVMKLIKKYVPKQADKIMLLATRVAIAAIAVTFILIDLTSDEINGAFDVLIKAINICTECIGLG